MFDTAEFLKRNLITGYWDESFSEAQVNIYSMNYVAQAWFDQEDVDEILEAIQPPEEPEYPDEEYPVE